MSYDARITVRKGARAASETVAPSVVVAALLGLLWGALELAGHAVPESVRNEITAERIIVLWSALAASPLVAGIGRAWHNWRRHRRL